MFVDYISTLIISYLIQKTPQKYLFHRLHFSPVAAVYAKIQRLTHPPIYSVLIMEIPQALIDLHSQADRLRAEIKVLEKTFEQAEQRSVSPGLPAPDYGLRRLVAIAIMPVACGSGG